MDKLPPQHRLYPLTPLRNLFQWSNDEEKATGYASSATITSRWTGLVSANTADNNNDDDLCHHIEAQKKTYRAQQKALKNIQQMLAQLLTNRNNNENIDSNHDEEKDTINEHPKIGK